MPAAQDPMVLEFPDSMQLGGDNFATLCQKNPNLRIEQDSQGNLIVSPPVNPTSGNYELNLGSQLYNWADRDGNGLAFSSSAVFTLPNGAKRGPDASWISNAAWNALSVEEQHTFSEICPHFVIELRSPSDRLAPLQEKMLEYCTNGAQLGFLADPHEKKVHVYRPQTDVELLDRPSQVSADPEMPGLVIQLDRIW